MTRTGLAGAIRNETARKHANTPWLLMVTLLLWAGGCGGGDRVALPCMERAVFTDPAESPYVLPYRVGRSYRLAQAYCHPYGGHRNQLAYDFDMPIGSDVVAARDGTVRRIRDDLADTGNTQAPGQHNHILIEHEDGTVAFYGHLQQHGVVVRIGEHVTQGQQIAASGNSGNTQGEPHLHFGVYQFWPATEGFDVAVNFRNADGPLDERRGLVAGAVYRAGPY
jgi:murein DD-endopeptidase MepM/ murein hydrolase activator NlpD